MRAAIYARVSSSGQRDNHTIESQLRVLRAYLKQQGWTLVDTYIDDGKSAATGKLDQRDGFARLVADADRKLFDVVLVVEVDRLTRTNSMEERAAILGPFQRNNVEIVTPHGGRLDLGTFLGEFFVTMQAIVAAEDKRKIASRTKAGKDRALSEGRKHQGITPYGYRYDRETHEWSINEQAAAIVREIYRRAIDGESCAAIAVDLADRNAQPCPPRAGWHRVAVYRIIRQTTAHGLWLADKRRRLKVALPSIVSEADWRAANRAIENGKLRGLRKTKHAYLLEGIATCGECGGRIYIRSSNRMRSGRMSEARYACLACKIYHHTAEVDERVWAVIERTLHGASLAAEIEAHMVEREGNRREWAADVTRYKAQLDRMTRAESALLARFGRGAINEAALDIELARMGKARAVLIEQLGAAQEASTRAPHGESAEIVAERLRKLADGADSKARLLVVRMLVNQGGAVMAASGVTALTMQIVSGSAQSFVRLASSRKYHVTLRVVA